MSVSAAPVNATPAMRVLRIGTRSSELALFQARQVQAALAERGVQSELATYTTVGDQRLDQPLSAIGAKGLFTQELEVDLLAGRVDCCVHSLKDLPTQSPPGLMVAAHLEREDARDALLLAPGVVATDLASLPTGALVGTSSLRRRAQLLALRPDLQVADLRGNVPTRVRKIDEGQVQAAVLAAAGLHRLGMAARIAAYLEPPAWLPAAGQGAIAIQVRTDDEPLLELFGSLDHPATTRAVAAERAFLGALEGGCQVPIGALAMPDGDGDGALLLHGLVASVDGGRVTRGALAVTPADPALAGRELATALLAQGASDILGALATARSLPAPQPE